MYKKNNITLIISELIHIYNPQLLKDTLIISQTQT